MIGLLMEAGEESVKSTKRAFSSAFAQSKIEASLLDRLVLYGCVGLTLFFVLFPFYWMVVTSIIPSTELYRLPPSVIPTEFTLEHYREIMSAQVPFYIYFFNSFLVATISSALAVGISIFGAYSFARLDYPGRAFMVRGVLLSYMIAGILMVIPVFQIIVWLGLVDTLSSVIMTHFIFTIPLGLYLLGNYFRSIPPEIEEAGMIDGYSRIEVLLRITIPMSIPAIVAVFLYSFLLSWNEYLYASIFLNTQELYTLPIGIEFLQFEFDDIWGEIMAASMVTTIPVVIMFLYLEKYMMAGLSFGSMD
ncbi:carbohydrate ABC transporter permease [Natrialbaceae archaeon A-CW3]